MDQITYLSKSEKKDLTISDFKIILAFITFSLSLFFSCGMTNEDGIIDALPESELRQNISDLYNSTNTGHDSIQFILLFDPNICNECKDKILNDFECISQSKNLLIFIINPALELKTKVERVKNPRVLFVSDSIRNRYDLFIGSSKLIDIKSNFLIENITYKNYIQVFKEKLNISCL